LLTGAGKTFDAVFFLTNYLGVLGIEAIKKLQIRVPEQLAVLCFDDNDIFRLYTPTISVIRQPIEAIGQKAMGVLLDRLRHTGEEVYVDSPPARLTADLVKRESI
jgi:LacI family transcriptional regulator